MFGFQFKGCKKRDVLAGDLIHNSDIDPDSIIKIKRCEKCGRKWNIK